MEYYFVASCRLSSSSSVSFPHFLRILRSLRNFFHQVSGLSRETNIEFSCFSLARSWGKTFRARRSAKNKLNYFSFHFQVRNSRSRTSSQPHFTKAYCYFYSPSFPKRCNKICQSSDNISRVVFSSWNVYTWFWFFQFFQKSVRLEDESRAALPKKYVIKFIGKNSPNKIISEFWPNFNWLTLKNSLTTIRIQKHFQKVRKTPLIPRHHKNKHGWEDVSKFRAALRANSNTSKTITWSDIHDRYCKLFWAE